MPAERITMRKLREILRLISVGDVPIPGDCPADRRGAVDDTGDDRADRRCKSELAVAGRDRRRRA